MKEALALRPPYVCSCHAEDLLIMVK